MYNAMKYTSLRELEMSIEEHAGSSIGFPMSDFAMLPARPVKINFT